MHAAMEVDDGPLTVAEPAMEEHHDCLSWNTLPPAVAYHTYSPTTTPFSFFRTDPLSTLSEANASTKQQSIINETI